MVKSQRCMLYTVTGGKSTKKKEEKKKEDTPMYLKDYERKVLLEKQGYVILFNCYRGDVMSH